MHSSTHLINLLFILFEYLSHSLAKFISIALKVIGQIMIRLSVQGFVDFVINFGNAFILDYSIPFSVPASNFELISINFHFTV